MHRPLGRFLSGRRNFFGWHRIGGRLSMTSSHAPVGQLFWMVDRRFFLSKKISIESIRFRFRSPSVPTRDSLVCCCCCFSRFFFLTGLKIIYSGALRVDGKPLSAIRSSRELNGSVRLKEAADGGASNRSLIESRKGGR